MKVVEEVARDICAAYYNGTATWELLNHERKEKFRRMARAAISAYERTRMSE